MASHLEGRGGMKDRRVVAVVVVEVDVTLL